MSEDDHLVPEPFIYSEDLRQELLTNAGHCRAVLSEEDIVRAAEGDLERGLKVALAVLQVADHRRRRAIDRASADPLLVLPQGPSLDQGVDQPMP